MAVTKCLECKYFREGEVTNLGRCVLRNRHMYPYETCTDFTDKSGTNSAPNDKVAELEERVAKLERLFLKML